MVHLRTNIKFALAAVLCMGGVVLADWDVGDPALYYQLPDFDGLSVYSEWWTGPSEKEGYGLADDWTAEVTAPITEIHFWGEWKHDVVGQTTTLFIQIFDNNPTEYGFPQPGECVWSQVIDAGQYTRKLYQEELQNFYDPRQADKWLTTKDVKLFQYNVPIMTNPFIEQAGQTYWLMISMDVEGGSWGWDCTEGVSGSSAVFWDKNATWGWSELMTPVGYQDPRMPLDMAFVLVTPEPATFLLFGLGALWNLKKIPRT